MDLLRGDLRGAVRDVDDVRVGKLVRTRLREGLAAAPELDDFLAPKESKLAVCRAFWDQRGDTAIIARCYQRTRFAHSSSSQRVARKTHAWENPF